MVGPHSEGYLAFPANRSFLAPLQAVSNTAGSLKMLCSMFRQQQVRVNTAAESHTELFV